VIYGRIEGADGEADVLISRMNGRRVNDGNFHYLHWKMLTWGSINGGRVEKIQRPDKARARANYASGRGSAVPTLMDRADARQLCVDSFFFFSLGLGTFCYCPGLGLGLGWALGWDWIGLDLVGLGWIEAVAVAGTGSGRSRSRSGLLREWYGAGRTGRDGCSQEGRGRDAVGSDVDECSNVEVDVGCGCGCEMQQHHHHHHHYHQRVKAAIGPESPFLVAFSFGGYSTRT
jgi:hypothetical protein